MAGDAGAFRVAELQVEAVVDSQSHAADPQVIRADNQPVRQEERRRRLGRYSAALDLNGRAFDEGALGAHCLQQQRSELDAGVDVLKGQVDQVMVDLSLVDVQAVGDRAVDADELEPDAGGLVRESC